MALQSIGGSRVDDEADAWIREHGEGQGAQVARAPGLAPGRHGGLPDRGAGREGSLVERLDEERGDLVAHGPVATDEGAGAAAQKGLGEPAEAGRAGPQTSYITGAQKDQRSGADIDRRPFGKVGSGVGIAVSGGPVIVVRVER